MKAFKNISKWRTYDKGTDRNDYTREYAKESRPFRSALFRAYGLSNLQGTFRRFLFKYFFFQSPLARGEEILEFASRFLACFDYPNISASFVRNICLADAFLCLLLPNDIRVLFPKKALLLRFPFPCTYPIPLGLKTKEEPRMNQGTPKERPTTQMCFLLRFAPPDFFPR